MKKLRCEMLIIVAIVSVFGFWALNEWNKRHPESKYVITRNKFGNYDIHLPSGLLCNGYYPSVEAAKRQIDFLIKREKPIKVYQGKWHRNYLEVVK